MRDAFSAWQAVPERQKAAKAAAEAALSAAGRALNSAKKAEKEAAEKAVVVAPVTREVTERDLIPLYKAIAAFDRAQAYPRCGEGWGDYPGEQAHIDAAVSMCKRGSSLLPLINRLARKGEICSTTIIELCDGEEVLA